MRSTFLAQLVALALVAAACGGGNTGSDDVASFDDNTGSGQGNPSSEADSDQVDDSGEVDVEAALLTFAQCMRDEGFDIEDPTIDADGNVHLPSPAGEGEGEGGEDHASIQELEERQEAASGACGEYLEGVTQTAEHGDDTEQLDSMLAFAQCMRDQGVDFDDPDPSAPGQSLGGGFHQLDQDDPAVQAALEVCQPELYGEGHG